MAAYGIIYAFMPVHMIKNAALYKFSFDTPFSAVRVKFSLSDANFTSTWAYTNAFFSVEWNIFKLKLCINAGNSLNLAKNTSLGQLENVTVPLRS